jgi:hypothetical protein
MAQGVESASDVLVSEQAHTPDSATHWTLVPPSVVSDSWQT